MSELKVNRATVIEWLDANEIEVTHTQLAGLFSSAIEAAPAQPVAELVTTAHGFETTLSLLPGHFDLPYGTHLLYAAPQPAALAQAATAKQSPHPEYDKGFSDGWNRCEARQAAAPTQAGVEQEAMQMLWDDQQEEEKEHYRNVVRAVPSNGALAAPAQPVTVPWENFPSYLIDHCEGDVISEEGLQFALSKMLSNPQYAPQPAAQTQTQEDVGGWRRAGALLYRLTGEHRPTNFDEIRVTMANGSRDIGQMSVQAERLLVMLTAPQPAAQAQEDVPDMFWDADDTENFAHEIQDIIDGYGPGEIVTIECAKRLPNLRVVVTRDGDGLSYEYLEAAIVAQEGGAHG